jgi:trehalose utilization protein
MIKVTIWNEFRHEKSSERVKAIYPNGLHAAIKEYLDTDEELEVRLAALDDEDQGLPDEVLNDTDVLLWWGHMAHKEVNDELVDKIQTRVYMGKMGFIALHSAHYSKPFRKLIGTSGNLSWGRDQKEIMWNLMPSHPIAAGIPDHFILESEELYSEPFAIGQPDALVFGGWFEDGHIMRSGACFIRGAGRIFYFQPGHEYCRSYYNPYVLRIIKNAIYWAKPCEPGYEIINDAPHITEPIINEFNNL